jgi:hypothetical protein
LKHETAGRAKTRQLAKRSSELKSEIYRLECLITAAPQIERQRRLANVNMVPPMHLSSPAPRNKGRVPIARQRAQRSERLRLWIECILILACIAGVTGWLNQWFHFWS